jgi:hypothetical protein
MVSDLLRPVKTPIIDADACDLLAEQFDLDMAALLCFLRGAST